MKDLFKKLPSGLGDLSDDDLRAFIAEGQSVADKVAETPESFISADRDEAALMDEVTAGVAEVERAKEELAGRSKKAAKDDEEPDEDDGMSADARAKLARLAETAKAEFEVEEPEGNDTEGDGDGEGEAAEGDGAAAAEGDGDGAGAAEGDGEGEGAQTASAGRRRTRTRLAAPSRTRAHTPIEEEVRVALTAAADNLGFSLGAEIDPMDAARMMMKRRGQFGTIPEGTHGEKVPIAKSEWAHLYPDERRLSLEGVDSNFAKVAAVTASAEVRERFAERVKEAEALVASGVPAALTASGGLCAPVTPYYNLQMISVADRPVRAALPSFNADRGGIRYARPAGLSAITTGVGIRTAAQDAAGGTTAAKTCQVVACPPFQETDVEIIYHCLQFGNLGARTFPERVAQWNALTLAAHARVSEQALLDGIDSASTQVTAGDLSGLGASAALPSQIVAAANGIRSQNRMENDAVLRCLLPFWVLDLLVSDVYRSQFQRFDMDAAAFIALLRQHNIEPSFYMDSATGRGQVFAAQGAAALNNYPATVVWYLFPEGSFLFLDGGQLELGLVRDSVLNSSNDFQIFGETFESVAFVGVQSYVGVSTVTDTGAVVLPTAKTDPIAHY